MANPFDQFDESPDESSQVQAKFKELASAFPRAVVSSLTRTPEHNKKVGGVANSQHMARNGNEFGTAMDIVVHASDRPSFVAQAKQFGFHTIDEGDHIHVQLPHGASLPHGGASGGAGSTSNPFDQFDAAPVAPASPAPAGNSFDQFDSPGAAMADAVLPHLDGSPPARDVGMLESIGRMLALGENRAVAPLTAMTALPVRGAEGLVNLVTGGDEHRASDAIYEHLVKPQFDLGEQLAIDPNSEQQSLPAHVAGQVAEFVPTLLNMIATGGAGKGTEGAGVVNFIKNALIKSAHMSPAAAIPAGAETFKASLDAGESAPVAALRDAGAMGETVAANAIPFAAKGGKLVRAATGAVGMPAVSNLLSLLHGNGLLPWQEDIAPAIMGAGMAAVGGERPTPEPASATLAAAIHDALASKPAEAVSAPAPAEATRPGPDAGSAPAPDVSESVGSVLAGLAGKPASAEAPSAPPSLGDLLASLLQKPAAAEKAAPEPRSNAAIVDLFDKRNNQPAPTAETVTTPAPVDLFEKPSVRPALEQESKPVLPVAETASPSPTPATAAPAEQPVSTGPAMFAKGKRAQAVRMADGTWQLRVRKNNQWQPWRAQSHFEPSRVFGYRPFTPDSGTVHIPGVGRITVGEKAAPAVKADPNRPRHLLEQIAPTGLNREAFRAAGINPDHFGQRQGFHYVFRKDGGMTPEQLREHMQQEGFLPPEDPNAPPRVDVNDTVDVLQRALDGEKIYSANDGAAVANMRAADHEEQQHFEARLAHERPDIAEEFPESARQVFNIAKRARNVGVDEFDIAAFHDETDADYLARMENEIAAQEARNANERGTDQRGNRDGVSGSDDADQSRAAGSVSEPGAAQSSGSPASASGDLFGKPSAKEVTDAEARRRDAERNGKAGTGRTDMLAGDGELFAGKRPQQADIEKSDETPPMKRSGAEPSIGLPRADIESIAHRIAGEHRDNVVIGTYDRLPQAIRDAAADQGAQPREIKAVFHKGKIHLVEGHLKDATAVESAMFHEFYGHYALKAKYGNAIGARMQEIVQGVGGLDGVLALAKKQAIDLSDYERGILGNRSIPEKQQHAMLAEELLAHMAETKGTLRRMVDEIVGAVRAFLRARGFPKMAELGVTDLAHVLKQARESLRPENQQVEGEPAFQRQPIDADPERQTAAVDLLHRISANDPELADHLTRFTGEKWTPDDVVKHKAVLEQAVSHPAAIEAMKAQPAEATAAGAVGTKNAMREASQEARGKEPVEAEGKRDVQSVEDAARATLAEDPDAGRRLTQELKRKGRPLTAEEQNIMALHAVHLENARDAAVTRMLDAQKSGDLAERVNATDEMQRIDAEFDDYEQANRNAGYEWHSSGIARQQTFTREGLRTKWSRYIQARRGSKLTQTLQARINELADKLADAEKRALLARQPAAKSGGKQTPRDRYAAMRAKLLEIASKPDAKPAPQPMFQRVAAAPRTDSVLSLVREMARALVDGGEDNPQRLIDTIHGDVGEAAGISREQLRDMVSGVIKGAAPTRSELQIRMDAIRKELRAEAANPDERRNATRQKQLQAQMADIQRRIETGDFSKAKREPVKYDEKTFEAQREVNRAQRELRKLAEAQAMKQETVPLRVLNFAQKLKLFNILTSITAFTKLPVAVVYRLTTSPVEEAIGSVWRHVPGLDKVFAEAPRHGQGFNAGAELAAIKGALKSPIAMKDALTKGYDKPDDAYGTKYLHADEWSHWSGRLHLLMKEPSKQAEFQRAFVLHSRFEYKKAIASGMTPTEAQDYMQRPSTQQAVGERAYANAMEAIAQGDNAFVDSMRSLQGSLRRSGDLGAFGAKAIDFVQPILKVPSNILKETTSLIPVGGFAKAAIKLRHGFEELSAEDADYVAKNIKKGTLGTVLLTLGAMLYKSGVMTGLQEDDDKKKGQDGGSATVAGSSFDHSFFHASQATLLQMGASLARHHEKTGSWLQAVADVSKLYFVGDERHYSALPVLDTFQRYRRTYQNAEEYDHRNGLEAIAGNELRSTLIPAIVQQEAAGNEHYNAGVLQVPALADPYTGFRKEQNLLDALKLGIPGLREQVPTKNPKHHGKG